MPDPTDNHGYDRPSIGASDWHIPLNANFARLDQDIEIRDVESALDSYTPKEGAKFLSIDSLNVFLGDGEAWTPAGSLAGTNGGGGGGGGDITTSDIVRDTAGREFGELTGDNDASLVRDAIQDRAGTASVVVPDPGFALDWNEQVDIPANESGFELVTEGLPTLNIPSGFNGNYAIRKGPTGAQVTGLRIGGFEFVDNNQQLNPAISLVDIKESVIHPSLFWRCPAIEILPDQGTPNQNKIIGPYIKGHFSGNRQAGILFGRPSDDVIGGEASDQSWVYSPHFIDTSFQDSEMVAYHDRGASNNWILTRAEACDTVHLMDGARSYYVSEGDWDRAGMFRRSIEERNQARGWIQLREATRYEALDLVSPQTRVDCRGQYPDRPNVTGQPVDILDDFSRATRARTLRSMGFQDESQGGGSVEIGPAKMDHCDMMFRTGGGGVASLTVGDESLKTTSQPKAAYSFGPIGGSDANGVVARHGFFAGGNNRAELIYDPGNELGGHGGDTWYFEVEVNGSMRQRNMGAGVEKQFRWGERTVHALNFIRTGDIGGNQALWTAAIEARGKERIEGEPAGAGTWHWSVESVDGSGKRWTIEPRDSLRLYRA